ncbi:hypothetical protein M9458_048141, partial [Cirrhinus mrigala]
LDFPPIIPLLSHPLIPAASALPSAHSQPTICVVGSPRFCQYPSTSWLEDPSSLLPASESQTPPRDFDPAAPPQLPAPSSPRHPPVSPGCLVPPALPFSVDFTPSAAPCRSVPPALLGSSFPPAPLQSFVTPAPLQTSRSP